MIPPAILFKYCDPRGEDIFTNLRLLATPPTRFNDPFEWLPGIEEHIDVDELRQFLTSPELSTLRIRTGFPASPPKNVGLAVSELRKAVPFIRGIIREGLHERANSLFRFICLSSEEDEALMWAHYSAGHTGFTVGFKTQLLINVCRDGILRKVEYTEDRPLIKSLFVESGERFQDLEKMFGVKSSRWSYEREYRLPRHPSALVESGGLHYQPIPWEAIDSVTFGDRCDQNLQNRILEMLANNPALKHVTARYITLHPTQYLIQVHNLKKP